MIFFSENQLCYFFIHPSSPFAGENLTKIWRQYKDSEIDTIFTGFYKIKSDKVHTVACPSCRLHHYTTQLNKHRRIHVAFHCCIH